MEEWKTGEMKARKKRQELRIEWKNGGIEEWRKEVMEEWKNDRLTK